MRIIGCVLAISGLFAGEYFHEPIHQGWTQSFEMTEMLHQEKTDFSDIAIFENPTFGRVLAINGLIQATEKDEAIYHEMLVHPALLAHGKPSSVLIIGGGNGGALREVLRHKEVDKAVVVEIDRRMIDLSKTFMPALSRGAFDDSRTRVLLQDPTAFLKESQEMFDVIICDVLHSADGRAGLFTSEFYGDCKKHLNTGGILIHPKGALFLQNEKFPSSAKKSKEHFNQVDFYAAPVPAYAGGLTVFGWGSDVKHTPSVAAMKKRLQKVSGKMNYYTLAIHKASFALPSFMLQKEKSLNKKNR